MYKYETTQLMWYLHSSLGEPHSRTHIQIPQGGCTIFGTGKFGTFKLGTRKFGTLPTAWVCVKNAVLSKT